MPLSRAGVLFSMAIQPVAFGGKNHLSWHINCLEMMVVFLAPKHFLPQLRGYHVLVHMDNTLWWSLTSITRVGCVRATLLACTADTAQNRKPSNCSPWGQFTFGAWKCGSRYPVKAGDGESTYRWWCLYGRGTAERKWTCSSQRSWPTVSLWETSDT